MKFLLFCLKDLSDECVKDSTSYDLMIDQKEVKVLASTSS